jgi:hypothetical protein
MFRQETEATMVRFVVGTSILLALLATYWVNPVAAWISLVATSTLAILARMRQSPHERAEPVGARR